MGKHQRGAAWAHQDADGAPETGFDAGPDEGASPARGVSDLRAAIPDFGHANAAGPEENEATTPAAGRSDYGFPPLDEYDAEAVRAEIHKAAAAFVDKIEAIWRGGDDRFHRVLYYRNYWRNLILSGVIVCLAVFALFFLTKGLGESAMIARAGGGGLALIFAAIGYVFTRKDIVRALENLDTDLHFTVEHYIKDELYERMHAATRDLPVGGKDKSDADAAARHLLTIFRYWRELERFPNYLYSRWQAYRLLGRERRDTKFTLGLLILVALAVLAHGAAFFYWERLPEIITTNRPVFGAAAGAGFGAMATYIAVMHGRMRRYLIAINDGLRIGSRLIGVKTAPGDNGQDWRVRIARMDPTCTIAGNYRTLLAAYVRATGPR